MKWRTILLTTSIIFLGFTLSSPVNAGVSINEETSLGTLGGETSIANGLNDLGDVVGGATLENGKTQAFMWDIENGIRNTNLSFSRYGHPIEYNIGIDIHEDGSFMGEMGVLNTTYAFHVPGSVDERDIPPGGPGQTLTKVYSTYGNSLSVGYAETNYGGKYGLKWTNGSGSHGMGAPNGYSKPFDISKEGIAGRVEKDGVLSAGYWKYAGSVEFSQILPPLTPTQNSEALGINDKNEIVGYSTDDSGSQHPVLWKDNGNGYEIKKLDNIGGPAKAERINNEGTIVGNCETEEGENHICAWQVGSSDVFNLGPGTVKDLNNTNWAVGQKNGTAHLWKLETTPPEPDNPVDIINEIIQDIEKEDREGNIRRGRSRTLTRLLKRSLSWIERDNPRFTKRIAPKYLKLFERVAKRYADPRIEFIPGEKGTEWLEKSHTARKLL